MADESTTNTPGGPTPTAAIASEPSKPGFIIYPPGWVLMKVVVGLLAVGLLISLMFNIGMFVTKHEYFQTNPLLTEKHHSGSRGATDKIAILKINGVILEGDGFVKHQIDQIRKDDNVKAVVLRVDSPGGAVSGADYMYHHLKKLREEEKMPIVVSMGSLAASGGYYVSMAVGEQENSIFAEPTCTTGSIGVIMPRYDMHELLANHGIYNDSIVSHEHKQLGAWTKEMTPDERKKLDDHIQVLFERFKDIIKEGRPMYKEDPDALDQLATGEVFTAEQAVKTGLVDQVGFIEEAIERAAEIAELDEDDYRVIEYEAPPTLMDSLGVAQAQPQSPLQGLLDASTPRAYYLYTWLPPMMAK